MHFWSAAEHKVHHAPSSELAVSLLAPSPSLVSPCSLAGRITYVQKDIAGAFPKTVCNTANFSMAVQRRMQCSVIGM